jgi:hypothetical protein
MFHVRRNRLDGAVRGATVVFAAGLLLEMLRTAVGADDVPPVADEVTLPAVRWDHLSIEARVAAIDPKGRVWYDLYDEVLERPPLDELKRRLEPVFVAKSPRIRNADLALLEDEGRAWFYNVGRRTLLGYDGKRWIERAAQPDCAFVGRCPSRGQLSDRRANYSRGKVSWFVETRGIHRFDGEMWTYQDTGRGRPSDSEQPILAVSPNGKYAVAHTQTGDSLWRCIDGRWSSIPAPTDEKDEITQLVVSDEGEVPHRTLPARFAVDRSEGAGGRTPLS